MRDVFEPTPLQRNDHLSDRYEAEILLKREDLTPVRSYKLRGAFNAMRKVLERNPDTSSFVCASAGNHAQGVAFMCRHFGVNGMVFMPVTTPQQKIMKTKSFGGEFVKVELTGDYFDDTLAAAQAQADRFQADGLLGALDVIARESPAAPAAAKNATNGRTNRGKRLLAEQEARQLGAVLAHPAFAANPVDTIFEHLANTLPPPPAAAAPTRGKKKRQQR